MVLGSVSYKTNIRQGGCFPVKEPVICLGGCPMGALLKNKKLLKDDAVDSDVVRLVDGLDDHLIVLLVRHKVETVGV